MKAASRYCEGGGADGGLGQIDCDCCDGWVGGADRPGAGADAGAGHVDDGAAACGAAVAGVGVGHMDCTVLSCCGAAGFPVPGPTLIRVGGTAGGCRLGAGARATTGLGFSLGFGLSGAATTAAAASPLSACSGGG